MTTTKKAATGKPVVSVAAVETGAAAPEAVTETTVEAEAAKSLESVETFDKKLEGFDDKSTGNDLEADVDETENEIKGIPIDLRASYEVTARIKKGKLPHWRSGLWFTREAMPYVMLGAHLSIVQSDPTIQIITTQLIVEK